MEISNYFFMTLYLVPINKLKVIIGSPKCNEEKILRDENTAVSGNAMCS